MATGADFFGVHERVLQWIKREGQQENTSSVKLPTRFGLRQQSTPGTLGTVGGMVPPTQTTTNMTCYYVIRQRDRQRFSSQGQPVESGSPDSEIFMPRSAQLVAESLTERLQEGFEVWVDTGQSAHRITTHHFSTGDERRLM